MSTRTTGGDRHSGGHTVFSVRGGVDMEMQNGGPTDFNLDGENQGRGSTGHSWQRITDTKVFLACVLPWVLIGSVVYALCVASPIILILGVVFLATRSAPQLRRIASVDPEQDFVAVATKCSILRKHPLKQTVFTALQGPCAGFRQMYKVLDEAPPANSTVNCWKPSNMTVLHEKGVMEYYRCATGNIWPVPPIDCQCWLIDAPEHILAEEHRRIKHFEFFANVIKLKTFVRDLTLDPRISLALDKTSKLRKYAFQGNMRKVQELLSQGVNAGAASWSKRTALHCAAVRGHTAIAAVLLEAGGVELALKADHVWLVGSRTALHDALQKRHYDTANVLLERGGIQLALMQEQYFCPGNDLSLGSPLFEAAVKGNEEAVRLLVEAGGRELVLNQIDHVHYRAENEYGIVDKMSALHIAAKQSYPGIVKLLLDKGGTAAAFATDANGRTPLHHAARHASADVVQLLLDVGGPQLAAVCDNAPSEQHESNTHQTALEYAHFCDPRVRQLLMDALGGEGGGEGERASSLGLRQLLRHTVEEEEESQPKPEG
eukprot:256433-Rhodomonas_salina.1